MSLSSQKAFAIDAFECCIRVDCDSAEIFAGLQRFLLPPMPRCKVYKDRVGIDISVRHRAGAVEILVDESPVPSAEDLDHAILHIVKALDDALVKRFKKLRAVHAGAVVLEGRALLVPGSTHAGKSSLIAELLRRGASHLSDEYALIDSEGRVHAYPRPLLLRNGSSRQSLVLPQHLNAKFASEPASAGWIIAVEYAPEGAWEVSEISQGQAVMLLLQNTPHEMATAPDLLERFVRLASGAECYAGQRGDVAEAAERILDLVRRK